MLFSLRVSLNLLNGGFGFAAVKDIFRDFEGHRDHPLFGSARPLWGVKVGVWRPLLDSLRTSLTSQLWVQTGPSKEKGQVEIQKNESFHLLITGRVTNPGWVKMHKY